SDHVQRRTQQERTARTTRPDQGSDGTARALSLLVAVVAHRGRGRRHSVPVDTTPRSRDTLAPLVRDIGWRGVPRPSARATAGNRTLRPARHGSTELDELAVYRNHRDDGAGRRALA